jgi:hypothetical protein
VGSLIKSLADPEGAQGTGLEANGKDSLSINRQHFMANGQCSIQLSAVHHKGYSIASETLNPEPLNPERFLPFI